MCYAKSEQQQKDSFMDKFSFEEALHIITNRDHHYESRKFHHASNIVWKEIELMATRFNPRKADEMTSTLFSRLLNRRNVPFQAISNPKPYIYTALKNIQKDIWRSEKRVGGFTDHLGKYHMHRSLDEYVADSNQSLHEKIAAPLMEANTDDDVLQLSALKEMVRVHLFTDEYLQVRSRSRKGERTFLTAAKRFQEFSEGTYRIEDPTPYKQFDRQRKIMLAHLHGKLPSTNSPSQQFIEQFVMTHDLQAQRSEKMDQASKDEKLNLETVHRQIETEIVFRALFEYLSEQGSLRGVQLTDIAADPTSYGLLSHCQYQLFNLEMFRTKKKRGSLKSLYCQFVSE